MAWGPIESIGNFLGGGLTSFLGDVFGGAISGHSAKQAAREQRNWEAKMSNTAMQRRVVDLKAAGINPMLAYMNSGQGASTPSGATAQTPDLSGVGSRAVSSATRAAEMKLLNTQVSVQEQTARKIALEADAQEIDNFYRRAEKTSGISATLSSAAQSQAYATRAHKEVAKMTQEIAYLARQTDLTYAQEHKLWSEISFIDASDAEKRMSMPYIVKMLASDEERKRLGLPHLRNMSEAEQSWWKQEVAPYMKDVEGIADIIGSTIGLGWLMRTLGRDKKFDERMEEYKKDKE